VEPTRAARPVRYVPGVRNVERLFCPSAGLRTGFEPVGGAASPFALRLTEALPALSASTLGQLSQRFPTSRARASDEDNSLMVILRMLHHGQPHAQHRGRHGVSKRDGRRCSA